MAGHQRTTRRPFTAERRRQFVALLRRGASVADACRLAECGRATAYDRRAADSAFRLAWDRAAATAQDGIDPVVIAQAARIAAATTTLDEHR